MLAATRTLLRSNAQIAKNIVQKRNMTVVVTPAREKVTNAEMFILAGTMVVGWQMVPAWVLIHMRHYRHLE
ncbi:uncharacterized protein LOC125239405 isoform X2 [Leguminivora glycinivorella]|uniref:uncharacterized protein LOC125239405 isoform X2 n=1 Tax=Leguminivora glycinivorella TaxID=1035111 RepID=UPI00200F1C4C|nr:uncharacterized protein LOC125239405 isoform X2 [Leguminivora glycinivorella]